MALEKTHAVHLTLTQMILVCRLVGAVTIEKMKNKDEAEPLLNVHERLKSQIKNAQEAQTNGD